MRSAAILVILAACYSPSAYPDCTIDCSSGACPSGFTCGLTDRLCYAEGTTTCGQRPDAPVMPVECVTGALLPNYCPPKPIRSMVVLDSPGMASTEGDNCMDVIPQDSGPGLCIYAVAQDVQITAALQFKGVRPVVIVALHDIVVTADLDVSRGGAGDFLPGSPLCKNPGNALIAMSATTGSAGGGGGGFMSSGGGGGPRVGDPATPGGMPELTEPKEVRPGCPGGTSGGNDQGDLKAPGGRPGGGIYLLAGGRVTMNATISAFGGGGSGADFTGVGGGGGGSGGMIVIEAPTVVFGSGAKLLAAGGGGGQGSNGNGLTNVGGVQSAANPTLPAPGGTGPRGPSGGKGSGGGLASEMLGASAMMSAGGGGGGGGAGYIKVHAMTVTGMAVSAPPLAP